MGDVVYCAVSAGLSTITYLTQHNDQIQYSKEKKDNLRLYLTGTSWFTCIQLNYRC
jgi:hypothetical protein